MQEVIDNISRSFVEIWTHKEEELRPTAFKVMNDNIKHAVSEGLLETNQKLKLMEFAIAVRDANTLDMNEIKHLSNKILTYDD